MGNRMPELQECLKKAAVTAACIAAAYLLLGGLLRLKAGTAVPGEPPAAGYGGDVTSLFPDESSDGAALVSECCRFTDFVAGRIRENDADGLYGLIAQDVLAERNGRGADREAFGELVGRLNREADGAELAARSVTVISGGEGTSPAAIVRAEFIAEAGAAEEEFLRTPAAPLFIYVYTGRDGHVTGFFLSVMEGGPSGPAGRKKEAEH